MSLGYDFPEELHVTKEMFGIEFTFPDTEENQAAFKTAKSELLAQKNECILKDHPKKKGFKQIVKGNVDAQLKTLLYILDKLNLFKNDTLPFPIEVIRFFKPDFDINMTRSQFEALNNPLLTPFIKPLTKSNAPDIKDFTNPIVIGRATFQVIVNALCHDPAAYKEKISAILVEHAEDKFVFQLRIPTLLPVAFKCQGHQVEATFAPFVDFSAEIIRAQFEAVLAAIEASPCVIAIFDQCDEIRPAVYEALSKFSPSLFLAASEREDSEDSDVVTTSLYGVVAPGTPNASELIGRFREEIPKIFEDVKLIECKNCRSLYNPNDNSLCIDPAHTGKQLPIDGNEMEVVDPEDLDEETGEPVVYVKWTCCGEVAKSEPCKEGKKLDHHDPDETKPMASNFSIEERHISRNE